MQHILPDLFLLQGAITLMPTRKLLQSYRIINAAKLLP